MDPQNATIFLDREIDLDTLRGNIFTLQVCIVFVIYNYTAIILEKYAVSLESTQCIVYWQGPSKGSRTKTL